LGQLRRLGVTGYEHGMLVVKDFKALQELADFHADYLTGSLNPGDFST